MSDAPPAATETESETEDQPADTHDRESMTRFRYDILAVIAGFESGFYHDPGHGANDQRPHGLGIRAKLDTRYSEEIPHSRLYQNLNTLAERGLISKSPADRRTNLYALTADGRALLGQRENWLRVTSHGPAAITTIVSDPEREPGDTDGGDQ